MSWYYYQDGRKRHNNDPCEKRCSEAIVGCNELNPDKGETAYKELLGDPFDMIFRDYWLYIPEQTIYIEEPINIEIGDDLIFEVVIPKNYLGDRIGYSIMTENDEIGSGLYEVFKGRIEIFNDDQGWREIGESEFEIKKTESEVRIIYKMHSTEEIRGERLRYSLIAGVNHRSKLTVYYGLNKQDVDGMIPFGMRYVVSLKRNC